LGQLSSVLRQVHKALVDAEAQAFGSISSPYQLLSLVIEHPHFSWLHALSELIVELDELRVAEEPLPLSKIASCKAIIEGLVGPGEPSRPDFRSRYTTLLQTSTEVAMAHGALRRLLDRLPQSP
jgi:hypothetical protein